MTQTVVLDLEGLKCMGCVANVEKAVAALDGVISAKADLATSEGTFVIDPGQVSIRDIIEAIKQAGYDASPSAGG